MNIEDMVPLGEHFTIALEQNVPYHLLRPYPNAWHVMLQTSHKIWFRCDGEDPAEGLGFTMDKQDGIKFLPICGDNFKMVTTETDCYVQVRFFGLNGSLIEL